MTPSRSPRWQNVRDLEDTMALAADLSLTIRVCLAHARQIGHRQILAELYTMRRDLRQLTTQLAAEWRAREEQAQHDSL